LSAIPAESAVAITLSPADVRCIMTVEVPALKNCQCTENAYFSVGKE